MQDEKTKVRPCAGLLHHHKCRHNVYRFSVDAEKIKLPMKYSKSLHLLLNKQVVTLLRVFIEQPSYFTF